MKRLDLPAVRWAAALAWAALLFFLSAQPVLPSTPVTFPQIDKVEHLSAYGMLAVLLARAFVPWFRARRPRREPRWVAFALVALLVFLYGVGDEIHQAFVPPRDCDPLDAAADGTAGVLVAGALTASRGLARRLGLQ